MVVKDFLVKNGLFYVFTDEYQSVMMPILREVDEADMGFLLDYLYWYYCSAYATIDIMRRRDALYSYVFKERYSSEEYNSLLARLEGVLEKVDEVVGTQEERVYRRLVERIDRILYEYSHSSVEDLSEEPKKVKALLDLIKIKAVMGKELGLSQESKKRGNMEESLLEKMI